MVGTLKPSIIRATIKVQPFLLSGMGTTSLVVTLAFRGKVNVSIESVTVYFYSHSGQLPLNKSEINFYGIFLFCFNGRKKTVIVFNDTFVYL